MRLSLLAALILPLAVAQDPPGQKHMVSATPNGTYTVSLSALNIERGAYPSIVKLKGNVEIKTPVCLPVGKQGATVCDGDMIVHADEADFHEDTGQIEARGSVTVTPLQHRH